MLINNHVRFVRKKQKCIKLEQISLIRFLISVLFISSSIIILVFYFIKAKQTNELNMLNSQIAQIETTQKNVDEKIKILTNGIEDNTNQLKLLQNNENKIKQNIEKQEEIYTDLTEKNKNYRSFNHLLSIIHSSKIFDNVTELQKLAFYVRQSSSMIPGNPLYIKLFDSRYSQDKIEFINKIMNKNNLIIIMKLDDGTKLGGFLRSKIPNSVNQEMHIKDDKAF